MSAHFFTKLPQVCALAAPLLRGPRHAQQASQYPHSTLTVPSQYPHSTLAVPSQCPRSTLTVPFAAPGMRSKHAPPHMRCWIYCMRYSPPVLHGACADNQQVQGHDHGEEDDGLADFPGADGFELELPSISPVGRARRESEVGAGAQRAARGAV